MENLAADHRMRQTQHSQVRGEILQAPWYRFRATFGGRVGYLIIVLLVGLLGGLSLGSIAGARRTESWYATYLDSTDPSDLAVTLGVPTCATCSGYSPKVESALARLPHVAAVESSVWSNPRS